MSDLNELQNDEEYVEVISLTDEDGVEQEFEYLDLIEYEGKNYALLLLIEESEDEEDASVYVFEVQTAEDGTEEYFGVEDEDLLDALAKIFDERFADEEE